MLVFKNISQVENLTDERGFKNEAMEDKKWHYFNVLITNVFQFYKFKNMFFSV